MNCLQKVLMGCLQLCDELSPKTVSMSCLVDELSCSPGEAIYHNIYFVRSSIEGKSFKVSKKLLTPSHSER